MKRKPPKTEFCFSCGTTRVKRIVINPFGSSPLTPFERRKALLLPIFCAACTEQRHRTELLSLSSS